MPAAGFEEAHAVLDGRWPAGSTRESGYHAGTGEDNPLNLNQTEHEMLLGHQIGKALIDELGLPKNTLGFTLRCHTQEVVSVECEYYVEDKGSLVKALAEYTLVPKNKYATGGYVAAPKHPAEEMGFDAWMRERTERAHAAFIARTSARLGYWSGITCGSIDIGNGRDTTAWLR